jgi:hypothetical protein
MLCVGDVLEHLPPHRLDGHVRRNLAGCCPAHAVADHQHRALIGERDLARL